MIDFNQLAAQLADNAANPNQLIAEWERRYFLSNPNFWGSLLEAFQRIYNKTAKDLYTITDLNPELKNDRLLARNRDLQKPLVMFLRAKVEGLCNTPVLKTSIEDLEAGCNCHDCPLLLRIPERIKAEVLPEAKEQMSNLPPVHSRSFLDAEIAEALNQQREVKKAAAKPGANLGGCTEMYVFNVEKIKALRGVFAPPVVNYNAEPDPKEQILKMFLGRRDGSGGSNELYRAVADAVPKVDGGRRGDASVKALYSKWKGGAEWITPEVISRIISELGREEEPVDYQYLTAITRHH